MFNIGTKTIGGERTFIIAELSCNHCGDLQNALEQVKHAHNCGADCVKLQTYLPNTITLDCNNEYFQINDTIWNGQTLFDLYSKTYTPWEWHKSLQEEVHKLGMEFMSSPFDTTAVDFLESLNVPAYKLASFEMTDHILIKKIAKTGKPCIISSGMASYEEIQECIQLLRQNGCPNIVLLKCTSAYPALPEDANLMTIPYNIEHFGVITGLSDHTLGIEIPIAAVALGAKVIEKHFKLTDNSKSEDDAFSLTPLEFKQMVDSIRIVEKALGTVKYCVQNEEKCKKYRRSLFVVKDIKQDEILTEFNIKSIRPGFGMHTKYYDEVLGKRANKDLAYGTPLKIENIY